MHYFTESKTQYGVYSVWILHVFNALIQKKCNIDTSIHINIETHWRNRITCNSSNFSCKQECIPVGCVPPACCPYLPACTAPGGTCLGVVYLLSGGCTFLGAYLPSGGVPAQWGCTCPVGVYLPGVYLPGGMYLPILCTCPGTFPLWTEWQTGAKILPCPKLRLRAVTISQESFVQGIDKKGSAEENSWMKKIVHWWN